MKKLTIGLLLCFFILVGCGQTEIKVYSDDEFASFNSLLENIGNKKTSAYDLRDYDECYLERIPGFYCSGFANIEDEKESLDSVANNLMLILGAKKKQMIILMDNDGENSRYLANLLFENGYKNIHYFESGYARYVELHPDFIPETGDCDCVGSN